MSRVPNRFPIHTPDGKCKLAFVGQSPGTEEVASGMPFVGPAGRELDRWFAKTNVVRSNVFIGNICQEHPPSNKISNWYLDKNCHHPNDKVKFWIGELAKELEQLRPNCIVALGNEALEALTGKHGIFNYWGSILPCTLVPGLKVVALPHPSNIIRTGLFNLRSIMILFLRRAIAQSEYPEIRLPYRNYILDPTDEEVFGALQRLSGAKKFAFDIENPKPYKAITCISFSDAVDWAISIPFVKGGHHRWHVDVETDIWQRISALLATPGITKIAHNLIYDYSVLFDKMKILTAGPLWCTQVANNRLYPDLTDKSVKKLKLNSLQFLTAMNTLEPYYKTDYKTDNEGDPTWKGPEKEFWLYNAKDYIVAFEIQCRQEEDMREKGIL